jgi:hypothetical protein
MKDRELFDRLAARAFALAEEAFPRPISLRAKDLLELEALDKDSRAVALGNETITWLKNEGLIRCHGPFFAYDKDGESAAVFTDATLTTKGFAALNATIDFGGKKGRAGQILVNQMKEVAKDTRSAAVSEILGRIIGAAAKTFLEP